ncbi:hypothetical protein ACKWTF_010602 [Chironomus riparius]
MPELCQLGAGFLFDYSNCAIQASFILLWNIDKYNLSIEIRPLFDKNLIRISNLCVLTLDQSDLVSWTTKVLESLCQFILSQFCFQQYSNEFIRKHFSIPNIQPKKNFISIINSEFYQHVQLTLTQNSHHLISNIL